MASDTAIRRAIAHANSLRPGRPAPRGKRDPRWLAIIRVAEFIESHPEQVCEFALKWMRLARGLDLPAALHCCLVEHLLEHHFDIVLPMFQRAALTNLRVADYFYPYSPNFQLGQAELPRNAARLKRLASELELLYADRKRRRKSRNITSKKQKTAARNLAAVLNFKLLGSL